MKLIINFFGLSGVGKTTLMNHLNNSSHQYNIPCFTVTRNKRCDDNTKHFEFLSVREYLLSRSKDEFLLDMDDGKTFYGYKKENLVEKSNSLLYGSPYFMGDILNLKGIRVLIEGDARQGLLRRGDSNILIEQRELVNLELNHEFYQNDNFRKSIHIFFGNDFSEPSILAEKLHEEIVKTISAVV